MIPFFKQKKQIKAFEGNMAFLRGPQHMGYYLGNGKDGKIYVMHNPVNDRSSIYDEMAIKIWEPEFQRRMEEIELQLQVIAAAPKLFRVPRIHHVDYDHGAFIMDRVRGETAHQVFFKKRRFMTEDFLNDIRRAFVELSKIGVCHNDAHTGNYMFTDLEIEEEGEHEVVTDGVIWIIDYGRSLRGGNPQRDLEQLTLNLSGKLL